MPRTMHNARLTKQSRMVPLLLVLLGMLIVPLYASAQASAHVDLRGYAFDLPHIAFDVRVKDAFGRDIVGLNERYFQLIEDGTPVAKVQVDSQVADAQSPVRELLLSDGNGKETISATGATIGIVFDATTLLNGSSSDGRDFVSESRQAIEQFIGQLGQQAPSNPESLGLFVPISSGDQQAQIATFTDYTQDGNALINYLRSQTSEYLRNGKTNLYAAIQEAVAKTASKATERGSSAVVLVVSDGGDAISGDAFNAIISDAKANNIKIIALGYGSQVNKTGIKLNQLASATGGVYQQLPDATAIQKAFQTIVVPTPAVMYTLRYDTSILDDGKVHRVVIEATLPDGQVARSQSIEFDWLGATGAATDTKMEFPQLSQILLRQYVIYAVPLAIVLSLAVVLLLGTMRWVTRTSLEKVKTIR